MKHVSSDLDSGLGRLIAAGTSAICDVIDALGGKPQVLDNSLTAVVPGTRFGGRAFTVSGRQSSYDGSGDHEKLAAIDSMVPGHVAVWAGADIQGVCCFGDLLGAAMKARGCVGAVVDGGIRDVDELRKLGLPTVARYRSPAQGIGRWKVVEYQRPVQVRGALEDWITINPLDFIVCDEDGVIAVPAEDIADVLERLTQLTDTEGEAREEIQNGMPLLIALKTYGHL